MQHVNPILLQRVLCQITPSQLSILGDAGVNSQRRYCQTTGDVFNGILLTMVDRRTNFAKEISALLRETYGVQLKVFESDIPHSVRAAETSAEGKSIFAHDPKGKVAEAYQALAREVMMIEKQRQKHQSDPTR